MTSLPTLERRGEWEEIFKRQNAQDIKDGEKRELRKTSRPSITNMVTLTNGVLDWPTKGSGHSERKMIFIKGHHR